MPTQVQFRRGTTAQNNAFTGAAGELSINSDNNSIRVHDGSTSGGYEVAKADLSNTSGIGSISIQNVSSQNLIVTGLSTFVGITTSSSGLFSKQLNVSGIITSNSYYIGATQVISNGRQLQNIASLDAITTATIESAVQASPNDFTSLNIAGLSTFVGIVTTQNNLFVGNDLNISGNAKIVGILTVGSSSIKLDGATNTINVGSGVTVNSSTSSFNQLKVAGVSTFSDSVVLNNNIGFSTDVFIGSKVVTVSSAVPTVIDSFEYESYRSVAYQVQITSTTDYHISNLMVVHDNFTVQIIESNQNLMYSSCGTFSGQINGNNAELLFTPSAGFESATIVMMRTLIRTSGNALGLVGDLSTQGGTLDFNLLGGSFDLNT